MNHEKSPHATPPITTKIAAARRYYNSVVQTYNSAIQSFPALLYAGMLGFRAREFFAVQDSERATPQVSTTA